MPPLTHCPSDAASALFPIRVSELTLEDLARVFTRQTIAKLNDPRHFVAGDPRREEGLDVRWLQGRSRLQLHCGCDDFAKIGIRNAEDGGIRDSGHCSQLCLDL